MRKILVTGGNTGIGFALCKQLATENNCHVYLGSRCVEKGIAAVKSILETAPAAKVELLVVDVSNDASVKAAARKLAGNTLYALVNNAGTGLNHGTTSETVLDVNLHGPKRMCEAFLPLMDTNGARFTNVSSGSASKFVSKLSPAEQAPFVSPDVTWEQILECVEKERVAGGGSVSDSRAYGLSKAGLTAYTMELARKPSAGHIVCSSCSPGFIATNMTKGYGAKLTPEQGTVSIQHCLFGDLGGNGWYFGSDAKRSPLDKPRNPGDPEYKP